MEPFAPTPRTLSLITTFRCTAACAACCFGCSPRAKRDAMSLRRMRHYIDTVLAAFGGSLQVVVFTGGECFLLGVKLRLAVAYASSKGLVTRVVTNGYWAASEKRALRVLRMLQRCGLREVNFSTGASHQQWVPQERVVNGCVAAARLGMTCVVNVEQHGLEDNGYQRFVEDGRIAELINRQEGGALRAPFMVMAGVWMEPAGEGGESNLPAIALTPEKGCDTLFDSLTLAPTGELYACCGLTARGNSHLKERLPRYPSVEDLRAAWERLAEDFLLLWLYAEGAVTIYRECLRRNAGAQRIDGMHSCAVCRLLFQEENLAQLRTTYQPYRARVFQLCALRQRMLYEEKKG